ncbi:MAG: hypothetical protein H0X37_17930 [Herpetosiphonaceae bacterium]|nr:hypothetical protein [Herpetosiphonaceae bacterium]
MNILYLWLTGWCLLLVACGTPGTTAPASQATIQQLSPTVAGIVSDAAIRTGMQTLATSATGGIVAAATAGNKELTKQGFDAFEATWSTIEDGVKSRSPDSYKAIEQAMNDLQDVALRADTIDRTAVQAKGVALTKALNDFSTTLK